MYKYFRFIGITEIVFFSTYLLQIFFWIFIVGPERAAVIGGLSGGTNTQSSQDDEYRFAGVEDPKIMITTSREPSARLKMFVKELRLVITPYLTSSCCLEARS